jgi:alcohol dehydrogenase class IV
MQQNIHFARGAIRCAGDILRQAGAARVLLVTGRTSYSACGAESALAAALAGIPVHQFSEFQTNPQLADVVRGLAQCLELGCQHVVAVGGGSVIDVAKLIALLATQQADPVDLVRGARPIQAAGLPLIAVPTTAGSGSEATHFAVVYVDGAKYSVAHPSVLPSHAVIDPALTDCLPPRLTAISGLDALAQAMESMWSVHSTDESVGYSKEAIRLVLKHLPEAVRTPTSAARDAMCWAAHRAGMAINLTKTTAAHALSYTMTSRFGVPHGQAVALTLGPMLRYNSQVSEDDVLDSRGVEHVTGRIAEIGRLLGAAESTNACQAVTTFIQSVGLETRLAKVGIATAADRALIAAQINVERLANNPRRLTQAALRELLDAIAGADR